MKNPIPSSNLFATYTLQELADYCESMSDREKATAYLIMYMTMNACHKLVEELHIKEAV